MRNRIFGLSVLLVLAACGQTTDDAPAAIGSQIAGFEEMPGFIDMYWDEGGGRLLLAIEAFDEPLIYQSGLARGIGSNDIGLDRGQLGATRIVEFQRSGPRVLLVERNLGYRAGTDNPDEQRAVQESFAQSVIWGFESLGAADGRVVVDATAFVSRDAHGVAARLAQMKEGTYAVDASRSAIYRPRTRAFPDNSEIEAIVTFTGKPEGEILATVVPDATSFSVHMHHSFVRAPDDGYKPLPYDSRAGVIGLRYLGDGFADYASGIGDSLYVNYGRRHRLQKADPSAERSMAVEPIVYYLDRAAPEPVRSALLDGARWWTQAFEAAGYTDAFRVEMLPVDADPMDVRYNVIQWVHRSTRGWSYGSPVNDPRTGEIIKGHVTLGSLRVRQDYLLAEGLLAPYADDALPGDMLEMSLARIRQLAAHEVGHTLGIEHNFAASTQDRSSVMDYPFPLIRFDGDGNIDLTEAYDEGIGEWDQRVILYAYQDFPDGADADAERQRILADTIENYRYFSDDDARDTGTAHPDANLWDNGVDPVAELRHLMRVRDHALENFSGRNVRPGRPLATLEEVLVPLYLLHRYQVHAAGKLIGGQRYAYAMRGDGQPPVTAIGADRQRDAIAALLQTMEPAFLSLPDRIVRLLPPRPPGFIRSRESFPRHTGVSFDPAGAADSAVALTLAALLDPKRAARLIRQHAVDDSMPGFTEVCEYLLGATWQAGRQEGMHGLIQRRSNLLYLEQLMRLSVDPEAGPEVRATAIDTINRIDDWLSARTQREPDAPWRAAYSSARQQIARFRDDPSFIEQLVPVTVPPGSPIGGAPGW